MMSDLKSACQKILEILEKYDLQKSECDRAELMSRIDIFVEDTKRCEFWDVLDVLYEISDLESVYLAIWDDCNVYQEAGFYQDKLSKLSEISGGDINFGEIKEVWRGDGLLDLKIQEAGGFSEIITLDPLNSFDRIPDQFIEYIKNRLSRLDGETKPLVIERGDSMTIYLLRTEVVSEISKVRDCCRGLGIDMDL